MIVTDLLTPFWLTTKTIMLVNHALQLTAIRTTVAIRILCAVRLTALLSVLIMRSQAWRRLHVQVALVCPLIAAMTTTFAKMDGHCVMIIFIRRRTTQLPCSAPRILVRMQTAARVICRAVRTIAVRRACIMTDRRSHRSRVSTIHVTYWTAVCRTIIALHLQAARSTIMRLFPRQVFSVRVYHRLMDRVTWRLTAVF
jgi:hypothetical protein